MWYRWRHAKMRNRASSWRKSWSCYWLLGISEHASRGSHHLIRYVHIFKLPRVLSMSNIPSSISSETQTFLKIFFNAGGWRHDVVHHNMQLWHRRWSALSREFHNRTENVSWILQSKTLQWYHCASTFHEIQENIDLTRIVSDSCIQLYKVLHILVIFLQSSDREDCFCAAQDEVSSSARATSNPRPWLYPHLSCNTGELGRLFMSCNV